MIALVLENMKFRLINVSIIILSYIQIEVRSEECGRRLVTHEALIVNGGDAKEGDWPWHVSILHIEVNRKIKYNCGGTLLDSSSVLTAAHCVYENGRQIVPDRILIQLGRNNLKTSGTYSQEIEVILQINLKFE